MYACKQKGTGSQEVPGDANGDWLAAGDAPGDPCGDVSGDPCGDVSGDVPGDGDEDPIVALTIVTVGEPLTGIVMLTATVPGGGGGELSCGDTCISQQLVMMYTPNRTITTMYRDGVASSQKERCKCRHCIYDSSQ